ncbi:MAG: hypothetical protein JW873_04515 [Candidatus Saganbacteria bacterium]|nr:hypothetical protein [Candidatus Saganbacteria bacterium]
MDSLDLLPVNLQTGFFSKKGRIEKEDGTKYGSNGQGVAVSGDISLDLAAKSEEGDRRNKFGLNLVTAQVDALVGRAENSSLRFALQLGPYWHIDHMPQTDLPPFRYYIGSGMTAVWENLSVGASGQGNQTISGSKWIAGIPMIVGGGMYDFSLEAKINFLIEGTSSYRTRTGVAVGYRPYANFNNKHIQAVDIFISRVAEWGKITGNNKEDYTLWLAGVKLNLSAFSFPKQ